VAGPDGHGQSDGPRAVLFARDAAVHGRLARVGDLLIATLDQRHGPSPTGQVALTGIGAFDLASGETTDLASGETTWTVWAMPALAGVDEATAYAYSRSGLVVALNLDGSERWRTRVPDDRAPGARARGDRDGPFVGDIVSDGSCVTLAAGAELLRLATATGEIVARTTACAGARAVVSRIALARDGAIVATCTQKTDWDDERERIEPQLWQPIATLESLRTAPGTVEAFDANLRRLWSLPPVPGIVYGDRRPATTADGTIILTAARTVETAGQRYVSVLHDWIVAVDGRSGAVVWQRDMPGGRGYVDPLVVADAVVAGYELTAYALADGLVRWQLPTEQVKPDRTAAPIPDGDRLLVASNGAIRAISVRDGISSDLARFAGVPFIGAVTTNLLHAGRYLYLGVREGRQPTQLRAVAVRGPSR